jgi:hypothetical protein
VRTLASINAVEAMHPLGLHAADDPKTALFPAAGVDGVWASVVSGRNGKHPRIKRTASTLEGIRDLSALFMISLLPLLISFAISYHTQNRSADSSVT